MINSLIPSTIGVVVTEKACTSCCLTKPVSDFSKHSSTKDGLQFWCKDCKRAHYAAIRDKILERKRKHAKNASVIEQRRQYRAARQDEIAEGKRRWYQANRDVVLEQKRERRAENPDVFRERVNSSYRNGGRPADKPWPDRPIAYATAHRRVQAIHGAARNHPCVGCGERAHAWAYDHTDPNPLLHVGVGRCAGRLIPYSPDPQRYDPMCRSCHVKRDRRGAARNGERQVS